MTKEFLLYLLAMAGVTYLIRMIPFTLIRGKIKSVYIQSFLYYVPYAVLGAMTFPYIFYSTGNMITAVAGTITAFLLSFGKKSLIVVSAASVLVAYFTGVFVALLG